MRLFNWLWGRLLPRLRRDKPLLDFSTGGRGKVRWHAYGPEYEIPVHEASPRRKRDMLCQGPPGGHLSREEALDHFRETRRALQDIDV